MHKELTRRSGGRLLPWTEQRPLCCRLAQRCKPFSHSSSTTMRLLLSRLSVAPKLFSTKKGSSSPNFRTFGILHSRWARRRLGLGDRWGPHLSWRSCPAAVSSVAHGRRTFVSPAHAWRAPRPAGRSPRCELVGLSTAFSVPGPGFKFCIFVAFRLRVSAAHADP